MVGALLQAAKTFSSDLQMEGGLRKVYDGCCTTSILSKKLSSHI